MGQPATAAIVVGCIVGGVVFAFVAYKVYVKYYYHRQRKQAVFPPTREPQGYANHSMTPSQNTMAGTLYGDSWGRDAWRATPSKASLTSHLDRGYGNEVQYPYHSQRRSSSQGLLVNSPTGGTFPPTESLAPDSPLSPSTDLIAMPPAALDGVEGHHHLKALSSSSSTMTLKRSYASSIKSGSGLVTGNIPPHRRESYLPHLPENRDQIQIVPPQPLGFGLGGMATAVDQKTLAFSTTSGIGGVEDDFSRGLIWQEGNPEAAAQLQAASKLGEEERMRYLAQGPVRSMSPGAMRGVVHNHLYAASNAGSSGIRTPDIPSSRSRSPAPITTWDASSSSDVGPSVSQRGAVPPSQYPLQLQQQQHSQQQQASHPLEHSNSTYSHHSQNARNAALTNLQSPLGLMSSGLPLHPLAAPSPQKGSTSNSPILSAFRNPGHAMTLTNNQESSMHSHSNSANSGSVNSTYNNGDRTPGLMSGSASTENGSGASDPPAPLTDSSGRESAADQSRPHDAFVVDEEKRIAIGKDGQLQVMGDAATTEGASSSPTSPDPNGKGKRQSKGWRMSRMLGGKA